MTGNVGTIYYNNVNMPRSAIRGSSDTRTVTRRYSGEGSAARIKADRRSALLILTIVMLAIFVLVGMRSYAAIIQHENNVLTEQNEYLQAEIDSLSSQIVEATKVTKLEKTATEEYGMVYPTAENCIRLNSDEAESKNLASVIRSEAYN
jgi:cell division protein FtsB